LATVILERPWPAAPPASHSPAKFKVDSEFGVLEAVLLGSPDRLRLVPCNAVSEQSLRCGRATSPTRAASQHRALARSLAAVGVEVHVVPSSPGLPDLAFARDSSFMTPVGTDRPLPGASHRRGEVDAVLRAAAAAGVPILGRIGTGRVEGGDICLLRPGVVAIGISEDRTDRAGAEALGKIFSAAGWETIYTRVDPALLHLDTHFCMLDRGVALGCTQALDGAFLEELARLDIDIIPSSGRSSKPSAATYSPSADGGLSRADRRRGSTRRCAGGASQSPPWRSMSSPSAAAASTA
jgi:N-dimethylarginine dimethylaminohydrolase